MLSRAFCKFPITLVFLVTIFIGSKAEANFLTNPGNDIDEAIRARVMSFYGKAPLSFEANRGQAGGRVRFIARGQGFTLFLSEKGEAFFSLREGGDTANRLS